MENGKYTIKEIMEGISPRQVARRHLIPGITEENEQRIYYLINTGVLKAFNTKPGGKHKVMKIPLREIERFRKFSIKELKNQGAIND